MEQAALNALTLTMAASLTPYELCAVVSAEHATALPSGGQCYTGFALLSTPVRVRYPIATAVFLMKTYCRNCASK